MDPLIVAALSIAVLMLVTWVVSMRSANAGIVDVAWGLGFVISAWSAHVAADAASGAAGTLALVCVTLWGLRLAVHLGRRNIGHEEDRRYAQMRAKRPERFWIWSLGAIFTPQGLLMFVIGLPMTLAVSRASGDIGVLGILGALVWLIGVTFETVGDAQLDRFKSDPRHSGEVMDRGLWRYTRHPNYFGDFTNWWGLWLISLDCGAPAWTAIGPLVMSILLMRVSGVTLLESSMTDRRPGYAQYIERTSAFFPRPPRRA